MAATPHLFVDAIGSPISACIVCKGWLACKASLGHLLANLMYVCFLFLCTAFSAALLDTHKKNVCSFGRLGLKLLEASPLTSRIARFTNSRALCVFFYATAVMCHDPDAWSSGRMLSEQVFIDCREPVVRFCFITVLLIVTSARVVILRFLTCFSFYIVCLCLRNCILEDGTLCIAKLPSSVLYSD